VKFGFSDLIFDLSQVYNRAAQEVEFLFAFNAHQVEERFTNDEWSKYSYEVPMALWDAYAHGYSPSLERVFLRSYHVVWREVVVSMFLKTPTTPVVGFHVRPGPASSPGTPQQRCIRGASC
jgi:hypothetical protein